MNGEIIDGKPLARVNDSRRGVLDAVRLDRGGHRGEEQKEQEDWLIERGEWPALQILTSDEREGQGSTGSHGSLAQQMRTNPDWKWSSSQECSATFAGECRVSTRPEVIGTTQAPPDTPQTPRSVVWNREAFARNARHGRTYHTRGWNMVTRTTTNDSKKSKEANEMLTKDSVRGL